MCEIKTIISSQRLHGQRTIVCKKVCSASQNLNTVSLLFQALQSYCILIKFEVYTCPSCALLHMCALFWRMIMKQNVVRMHNIKIKTKTHVTVCHKTVRWTIVTPLSLLQTTYNAVTLFKIMHNNMSAEYYSAYKPHHFQWWNPLSPTVCQYRNTTSTLLKQPLRISMRPNCCVQFPADSSPVTEPPSCHNCGVTVAHIDAVMHLSMEVATVSQTHLRPTPVCPQITSAAQ